MCCPRWANQGDLQDLQSGPLRIATKIRGGTTLICARNSPRAPLNAPVDAPVALDFLPGNVRVNVRESPAEPAAVGPPGPPPWVIAPAPCGGHPSGSGGW